MNPFSVLGMSRAEATALIQADPENRQVAVNLLRRYFGLLFHPDRVGDNSPMAQLNQALDLLSKGNLQAFLADFRVTAGPSLDQDRWYRQKFQEQREETGRAEALLKGTIAEREARIRALEDTEKDLRDMLADQQERIEKYRQDAEFQLVTLVGVSAPQRLKPLGGPQILFTLGNPKRPWHMTNALSGLWREARKDEWAFCGQLLGFLGPEDIEALELKVGRASNSITWRSPNFRNVALAVKREPQVRGAVLGGKWRGMRILSVEIYGTLREWRAYEPSITKPSNSSA